MKGNRQGFLSRSITRRSGKIAKQYYKKFCNFEGSLAKDPPLGIFTRFRIMNYLVTLLYKKGT